MIIGTVERLKEEEKKEYLKSLGIKEKTKKNKDVRPMEQIAWNMALHFMMVPIYYGFYVYVVYSLIHGQCHPIIDAGGRCIFWIRQDMSLNQNLYIDHCDQNHLIYSLFRNCLRKRYFLLLVADHTGCYFEKYMKNSTILFVLFFFFLSFLEPGYAGSMEFRYCYEIRGKLYSINYTHVKFIPTEIFLVGSIVDKL